MAMTRWTRRAVALAGLVAVGPAWAQEAALSEAATQPAKGRVTWRESLRFTRYELSDRTVDEVVVNTRLTLGLNGKLSAVLDMPLVNRDDSLDGSRDANGVGDLRLGVKWRFWQDDRGAIETKRLAAFGGLRLPTGTDGMSSGGVDPYVGLVYTMVHGRHGVNAAVRYTLTTDGDASPLAAGYGGDDLLTLETSYLYRLSPSAYTADTEGSLYAALESFVDYETNGDAEWRLAPGLLWEARRWAAELNVILPVARSVDERARTDWGFAAGVRVLF
ncbi:MAG: hypothetical protein D6692_14770 [Planctomycetota bacterium]|nr:MAG: hypothetical protein D6692_14770 [Planctomycetota bacterium]